MNKIKTYIFLISLLTIIHCTLNNPLKQTFDMSPPDAPVITGVSEGNYYLDTTIDVIEEIDNTYTLSIDGIPYTRGTLFNTKGTHTVKATATKNWNKQTASTSCTFTIVTRPTIISTYPLNNGTSIPDTTNIELTFDYNLEPSTFGTVVLNGTTYTNGSNCSMSISGDTVTINPDTDLNCRTNYSSLSVSGFISEHGFEMISYNNISYTFRTIVGIRQISSTGISSSWPRVEYNGSGYGVCYNENSEVYLTPLNNEGSQINSTCRVTNDAAQTSCPDMVWNGSIYGIVYYDNRSSVSPSGYKIFFSGVNTNPTETISDTVLSTDSVTDFFPAIAWNGTDFGCIFNPNSPGDRINFIGITSGGSRIGSEVTISSSGGWGFPDIVYNGSGYGTCWYDERSVERDVNFVLINTSGTPTTSVLDLGEATYSNSRNTNLVWTGSEYGVVYFDDREGNNEIYLSRVNSAGDTVYGPYRITNDVGDSRCPDIAWNGSEYGIIWQDNRSGATQIYFQLVDSNGSVIGSPLQISNSLGTCGLPEIKWTANNEFAVVWYDNQTGANEIYFTVLKSDGNYK